VLLTLLALAASTPALATSDQGTEPATADRGPAALAVSTSLDSCGDLDGKVICKLDVSYNAIPEADSYSASVTRADGSTVDYGGVAAGGTSLWVPYVGAGNYSVRVTAYAAPERPDRDRTVVTTESSRTKTKAKVKVRKAKNETRVEARATTAQAEAESRGATPAPAPTGQAEAQATATPTPNCAEAAPPEPIAPEPLPEPPPEDLDPANPDEDADGILDEQERQEYDAAVAEREAAEAVAQVPQSVDC
jgi:hypothetical protein